MTHPERQGEAAMGAWVALLRTHSRVVPLVDRDLEAATGIPLSWFDVLFQLSVAPQGQRRMHDLAEAVLLSKSGLTRLVDRIEEAGLVERAAIPGDRRSLHVRLTPAGRQMIEEASVVIRGIVDERFGSHLRDAELSSLRDILERVAPASGSASRRRRVVRRRAPASSSA